MRYVNKAGEKSTAIKQMTGSDPKVQRQHTFPLPFHCWWRHPCEGPFGSLYMCMCHIINRHGLRKGHGSNKGWLVWFSFEKFQDHSNDSHLHSIITISREKLNIQYFNRWYSNKKIVCCIKTERTKGFVNREWRYCNVMDILIIPSGIHLKGWTCDIHKMNIAVNAVCYPLLISTRWPDQNLLTLGINSTL